MPLAQNLPQNFAGLQQQAQQPNLTHLNQYLPQQQARPQVCQCWPLLADLACWRGLLLHGRNAEPDVEVEVIRANTPDWTAWDGWHVNCHRLRRTSTLAQAKLH